jgi:hypothetical protein
MVNSEMHVAYWQGASEKARGSAIDRRVGLGIEPRPWFPRYLAPEDVGSAMTASWNHMKGASMRTKVVDRSDQLPGYDRADPGDRHQAACQSTLTGDCLQIGGQGFGRDAQGFVSRAEPVGAHRAGGVGLS